MRSVHFLDSLLAPIISSMGLTIPANASIEPPKDKKFGDLACNHAMLLAKQAGRNPRELASAMADALRLASPSILSVDVAGPGFLNVFFVPGFWQENVALVEQAADRFGAVDCGKGQKVQVEFVSANPTGPLHIGHGRGAAIGDSTATILAFAGYEVEKEYYVNDAGKQMRTLGLSIWLRARAEAGKGNEAFPEDCYQGQYVTDMARDMLAADPSLVHLPDAEGIEACRVYGTKTIMEGIRKDLNDFGVHHDVWFSELSLSDNDEVAKTLNRLASDGIAYEKDGALWFRTEPYGDDKDRVLKKSDGSLTYFASDIAYHDNKYHRGFTKVIDVWGADHHGYILRMRAAIEAMGQPKDAFDVILVQLVNLLKDGEQIAMSTRAGKFDTLAEVLEEVGSDAARFIFLSRKSDSKLDFDLSLVKQRTMDNPVYYVQYAHARICALLRRAGERDLPAPDGADLGLLIQTEELDILKTMDRFPQVVYDAAASLSPHFVSYFLMDLAGLLHKYYSVHQILGTDDQALALARLRLARAAGQVLRNGLVLLGVSAPEVM